MNIEELKEFLQDEKNKGEFDSLVKDLGYETKESIDGLKQKNYDLIGKLKNEKTSVEEIKKQLDNIDLDGYNEYISNKDNTKGVDLELKKTQRLLKDFEEKNLKIESDYHNLLKQSALQKALIENGFDETHSSMLINAHLGRAKVENDEIVIEDNGLGLPVNDFFKKMAESETGKLYLKKPVNSGAGSTQFNSSGKSGKTITSEEFNSMSNLERRQISNDVATGKIVIKD